VSEINSILPDPEVLLALEPEEVGGFLLQYLNSLPEDEQKRLNFYNFSSSHFVRDYPKPLHEKIKYAFMEGVIWLENEGLIAPRPEGQRDFVFITRRGRKLLNYDTAVFQSFKEVEIAVRKAGSFKDTLIGPPLMCKAFDVEKGPLTISDDPVAEREGVRNLFSGAMGFYRNPSTHRDVLINNPQKAAEIIIFASHLLGIVYERTSSSTS